MKDKDKESLLKDSPEYEDYNENVAVLTQEELIDLGFTCCGSKGKCGNCKGKCTGNCKNKKTTC